MVKPARVQRLNETWLFLKRWWAHPLRLGAVLPSSVALATFMARAAVRMASQGEYVLDLGAGTGRMTRALLAAGVPADRLIALELDPSLCAYLRAQREDVMVLEGNACFLPALVPESLQGKIGVIVSGLPMLSFPVLVREKIVQACRGVLKTGGSLLQFTYGPSSSIQSDMLGLTKERLGSVWTNIPPAHVWRYQFRDDVERVVSSAKELFVPATNPALDLVPVVSDAGVVQNERGTDKGVADALNGGEIVSDALLATQMRFGEVDTDTDVVQNGGKSQPKAKKEKEGVTTAGPGPSLLDEELLRV